MSAPFRLASGSVGPRQQSPTTCGSACATIARMLVDAPFARWVVDGEGHPVPGAEGETGAERFASWERTVQAPQTGQPDDVNPVTGPSAAAEPTNPVEETNTDGQTDGQ